MSSSEPSAPVFSCASGVRSVHAIAAAQQSGLDVSEHYAGAFKDWYAVPAWRGLVPATSSGACAPAHDGPSRKERFDALQPLIASALLGAGPASAQMPGAPPPGVTVAKPVVREI
jgi:hypothetical protein